MGVFKDANHLYECIGGLFDILKKDETIGPKLRKSELLIRFTYREPDAVISIDCSKDPEEKGAYVQWFKGKADFEPIVEMTMKADVAHRFWLGKVNLLMALAKKQIIAKGPIPKLLKLLPVVKPAFKIYPELLREKGYAHMIE